MPKSKRNKVVSLTKAKKKGKGWKEGLVSTVRQHADNFPSIYLFRFYNMRTETFKELREELRDGGRFVLGSNKVMQVALGKGESDEHKTGLHELSERLRGPCGLFFTSLPREEVVKAFSDFTREDFARAGAKATEDFDLPAGPLEGPSGPLSHTIEPMLRKLGLPTKLNKGIVELVGDYSVCKAGRPLTANQAALLRVFGVKMAVFRLKLLACWTDDKVEQLAEDDDEDDELDAADMDEFADEGLAAAGIELDIQD